nr:hypothetical protein [Tanacetum cinerariifolium]
MTHIFGGVTSPVNTVRPVNTADSKPIVNYSRPISNAFKRGHLQVTRPYNKYSAYKKTIFNKMVNTIGEKDTTARERAVVRGYMGREANAGNPHQKEYKEKGVIDRGCSRHMIGNKCYLTDYEDYDGGFISFGDGTACLPNDAIFEGLQCLSAKTTAWNEFSSTMAFAIICLANNQKFNFSKYILKNVVKNLEAGVKFYMFPRFVQVLVNHQLGDMSHHKEIFVNPSLTKKVFTNMKRVRTEEAQTTESYAEEKVPTHSHDLLSSGEDRLQLNELMDICTKLSDMVLSLEQTKTNQAAKIEKLKKRVEKLEGKKKKRTHGLKRLYKDATVAESVKGIAAAIILQISKDELTLAQTLMEIKAAKPKAKWVTIQEPSEFRTTSPLQPSQPLQAKDKGKGIMVEPKKPLKKKDQIALDEEVA